MRHLNDVSRDPLIVDLLRDQSVFRMEVGSTKSDDATHLNPNIERDTQGTYPGRDENTTTSVTCWWAVVDTLPIVSIARFVEN
jgi:hypothetical protein